MRFTSILECSINRETYARSTCNNCGKTMSISHSKVATGLPRVLSVNVNLPSDIEDEFFNIG